MNVLDALDRYVREILPARMTPDEHGLLSKVGVPVAIEVASTAGSRAWIVQERDGVMHHLPQGTMPSCRFRLRAETFLGLIAARLRPSAEFLAGRIAIDGNIPMALRVSSLLEGVFRRSPWRPEDEATAPASPRSVPLSEHQRRILSLHLDPDGGSPYWIERADVLGIRADDLIVLDDLAAFGEMDREALAGRSFRDFLPRSRRFGDLFVGETGGTTGRPAVALWSDEDFRRAFVRPLVDILAQSRIELRLWLFAGPTGPHAIGRAASLIAAQTTGIDALRVDFDPRWHRRLPAASLAARRHVQHIVEQTVHVLERERPDALFVTPSLLVALVEAGHAPLLADVRLVHFGGQSISPEEDCALRDALPGDALVLNGYGNSLFGCLVEDIGVGRLHYPIPRDRVVVRLLAPGSLVDEVGENAWGRVMFHRFDESMMLLNAVERDEAMRRGAHLHWPRPIAQARALAEGGIY